MVCKRGSSALWVAVLLLSCVFSLGDVGGKAWAAGVANDSGDKILKVNQGLGPPFSKPDKTGFYDLLFKELYGRFGYSLDVAEYPAERVFRLVDAGIIDVEEPRTAGMNAIYPNIIQGREPMMLFTFSMFTRNCERLSDWTSLEGREKGFIVGWKILERKVPKRGGVETFITEQNLFKNLAEDRLDIGIYEKYSGRYLLDKFGGEDIPTCPIPLAAKPMYVCMNKKHADLMPRLDAELRKMKDDGTFSRIFKQAFGQEPPRELLAPVE